MHPRYPFFLPVKVLSRVFRGKFVAGLKRLYRRRTTALLWPGCGRWQSPSSLPSSCDALHRQDWVVYAKPAFGGPSQVLRYLGRYTHRVAISNHRLLAFDGEHVTFRWKDYAHGGKQRKMTLLPTSSCAASSCTCCRRASFASATSVSSPTASANRLVIVSALLIVLSSHMPPARRNQTTGHCSIRGNAHDAALA